MKVVGIAGSPRRGGNTDTLLAEVLRGATDKGAETKTVILMDLNIRPCHHCDYCQKAGACHIHDDIHMINREMAEADVIVLASPVHFMGVTSILKTMIDRGQAMWARKYVLKIPPLEPVKERKGLFISVGGRKSPKLFEPSETIVKAYFAVLNIKYAGGLLFAEIDEKGAINKRADLLQQAYESGQKLVE
jgi:multimeric flavodoxin WrbA